MGKLGAGGGQANGVADRAVQSLGEQVRFLRHGLATRLGVNFGGMHPVFACLVEHVADVRAKYGVSANGRACHEG